MTADEMIDGYVADVVLLLPRRQRPDVARELRATISEEVDAAAETRPTRAEAVTAVLAGFGRPDEVAARYGPPVTLIDPSDTRRFLTLAGCGAVLILTGAVLQELIERLPPQRDIAAALDRAGPLVFMWVGLLAAWFAVAAWSRRRRPPAAWKPHPVPTDRVSRIGRLAGLAFFVAGTLALVDPAGMLRLITGDRAAPSAYQALAYEESFLAVRGPIVLALLILGLIVQVGLAWQGRWRPWTHYADLVLGLTFCAVLTWVVAGPIFQAAPADRTVKDIVALIILVSLIDLAVRVRRHRVRQAVLTRG